ncbi:hypothetical protein V8E54_013991, partial [Elaphomyces granulatus]
ARKDYFHTAPVLYICSLFDRRIQQLLDGLNDADNEDWQSPTPGYIFPELALQSC